MAKYYVFLDIDGVLWNFKSLFSFAKDTNIFQAKKQLYLESVQALNVLIERLNTKYSVTLVITSVRRFNVGAVIKMLKTCGLNQDCEVNSTPFLIGRSRAYEVAEFLSNVKDKFNYLIIDDIGSNFLKKFDKDKFIRTSLWNKSIDEKTVYSFCEEHNL